jgi:hypothetical protein
MTDTNQILVLRDNAKYELLQIKSVEDGISYLNKLKAIDVWVKAEKKDAELQNIVAEQKLRTQRILGELISEGQRKGTIRKPDEYHNTSTSREVVDLGITHKQSSTFQQIASIPDEDFEEFIEEKKAKVNDAVAELTTTGAVRLAKTLQEKKADLKVVSGINDRLAIEKELKELAQNINMKYTKEQRIFLINHIKQ